MREDIVNSTAAILRNEQDMASRSTRRSSPVSFKEGTPNELDSGPAMSRNEAPEKKKGAVNMQRME